MSTDFWPAENIKPRYRVITDNDYSADPDGLVQLAHELLSPSTETVGIIGTRPLMNGQFIRSDDTPAEAVEAAEKIVELCGFTGLTPVFKGSIPMMVDRKQPLESSGIRAIIREAMRDDTEQPLFVVCGASLSEIASAWLIEPRIAERLTLVWIGGHEYEGLATPPPGGTDLEYNLHIDPIAAQVVFNDSNLNIWQFPRDVYRTVIASRSELYTRVRPHGPLGQYLYDRLGAVSTRIAAAGYSTGEVYILGDSPMVLAVALQSVFEPDTSSSFHVIKPCPNILDSGLYEENPNGRPIRVYTQLDNRVLLEDLYAKLQMHNEGAR
jgi:purine nucleosidase